MKKLLMPQDAIDLVPAAIYICSAPSGQIVQFNRAASELWGCLPDLNSTGCFCGFKALSCGIPIPHAGNLKQCVLQSGASVRAVEGIVERPDGSQIKVVANIDPIRDDSGNIAGAIHVLQALTAQLDTPAPEAQLINTQRLETVGLLADGVAHDFNNLLMVISGQAELLLGSAPSSDLEKRIGKILSATESAGQLTKKLIAFGRKQSLASSAFDVNSVFEEINDLVVHVLPRSIDFSTRLSPSPCWVYADRAQIEQTIVNLILNARDAMPKGGKLIIATSTISTDGNKGGQHGDIPAGDYVLITIADTGEGIPEQYSARVFEPFFTTKPRDRGTGLGLSVAHDIVRQSGGHIRLASTVGVGTTFSIYLPSSSRDHPKQPVPSSCPFENANASCPLRGTVLVVDDEEPIRTGLRAVLESFGLAVVDAGDASEALQIAAELKEQLVLLITDIVMPKMKGTELARLLVARHPDLPVIFMSGYTAGEIGYKNFRRAKFLQKPFGRVKLLEAICEGLNSCPLRSDVTPKQVRKKPPF